MSHPEELNPVTPARRRNDDPEHRLSHWFGEMVERVLMEPCWCTAIDHSGRAIGASNVERRRAQMIWRERQKKMGIKPDHLDWYFYQVATGIYAQFELKRPDGGPGPTTGQEDTMRLLRDRGIPNGWGRSILDGFNFLRAAGFRLHPNSGNIVTEIIERHAAAEREAAVKKAAPRKRAAPRKAAPRYLWKAHA